MSEKQEIPEMDEATKKQVQQEMLDEAELEQMAKDFEINTDAESDEEPAAETGDESAEEETMTDEQIAAELAELSPVVPTEAEKSEQEDTDVEPSGPFAGLKQQVEDAGMTLKEFKDVPDTEAQQEQQAQEPEPEKPTEDKPDGTTPTTPPPQKTATASDDAGVKQVKGGAVDGVKRRGGKQSHQGVGGRHRQPAPTQDELEKLQKQWYKKEDIAQMTPEQRKELIASGHRKTGTEEEKAEKKRLREEQRKAEQKRERKNDKQQGQGHPAQQTKGRIAMKERRKQQLKEQPEKLQQEPVSDEDRAALKELGYPNDVIDRTPQDMRDKLIVGRHSYRGENDPLNGGKSRRGGEPQSGRRPLSDLIPKESGTEGGTGRRHGRRAEYPTIENVRKKQEQRVADAFLRSLPRFGKRSKEAVAANTPESNKVQQGVSFEAEMRDGAFYDKEGNPLPGPKGESYAEAIPEVAQAESPAGSKEPEPQSKEALAFQGARDQYMEYRRDLHAAKNAYFEAVGAFEKGKDNKSWLKRQWYSLTASMQKDQIAERQNEYVELLSKVRTEREAFMNAFSARENQRNEVPVHDGEVLPGMDPDFREAMESKNWRSKHGERLLNYISVQEAIFQKNIDGQVQEINALEAAQHRSPESAYKAIRFAKAKWDAYRKMPTWKKITWGSAIAGGIGAAAGAAAGGLAVAAGTGGYMFARRALAGTAAVGAGMYVKHQSDAKIDKFKEEGQAQIAEDWDEEDLGKSFEKSIGLERDVRTKRKWGTAKAAAAGAAAGGGVSGGFAVADAIERLGDTVESTVEQAVGDVIEEVKEAPEGDTPQVQSEQPAETSGEGGDESGKQLADHEDEQSPITTPEQESVADVGTSPEDPSTLPLGGEYEPNSSVEDVINKKILQENEWVQEHYPDLTAEERGVVAHRIRLEMMKYMDKETALEELGASGDEWSHVNVDAKYDTEIRTDIVQKELDRIIKLRDGAEAVSADASIEDLYKQLDEETPVREYAQGLRDTPNAMTADDDARIAAASEPLTSEAVAADSTQNTASNADTQSSAELLAEQQERLANVEPYASAFQQGRAVDTMLNKFEHKLSLSPADTAEMKDVVLRIEATNPEAGQTQALLTVFERYATHHPGDVQLLQNLQQLVNESGLEKQAFVDRLYTNSEQLKQVTQELEQLESAGHEMAPVDHGNNPLLLGDEEYVDPKIRARYEQLSDKRGSLIQEQEAILNMTFDMSDYEQSGRFEGHAIRGVMLSPEEYEAMATAVDGTPDGMDPTTRDWMHHELPKMRYGESGEVTGGLQADENMVERQVLKDPGRPDLGTFTIKETNFSGARALLEEQGLDPMGGDLIKNWTTMMEQGNLDLSKEDVRTISRNWGMLNRVPYVDVVDQNESIHFKFNDDTIIQLGREEDALAQRLTEQLRLLAEQNNAEDILSDAGNEVWTLGEVVERLNESIAEVAEETPDLDNNENNVYLDDMDEVEASVEQDIPAEPTPTEPKAFVFKSNIMGTAEAAESAQSAEDTDALTLKEAQRELSHLVRDTRERDWTGAPSRNDMRALLRDGDLFGREAGQLKTLIQSNWGVIHHASVADALDGGNSLTYTLGDQTLTLNAEAEGLAKSFLNHLDNNAQYAKTIETAAKKGLTIGELVEKLREQEGAGDAAIATTAAETPNTGDADAAEGGDQPEEPRELTREEKRARAAQERADRREKWAEERAERKRYGSNANYDPTDPRSYRKPTMGNAKYDGWFGTTVTGKFGHLSPLPGISVEQLEGKYPPAMLEGTAEELYNSNSPEGSAFRSQVDSKMFDYRTLRRGMVSRAGDSVGYKPGMPEMKYYQIDWQRDMGDLTPAEVLEQIDEHRRAIRAEHQVKQPSQTIGRVRFKGKWDRNK